MSRRKSRIVAFQGLDSWDGGGQSEKDVMELSWIKKDDDTEPLNDEDSAFARMLIAGSIENIGTVDEKIKARVSPVDGCRCQREKLLLR